MADYINYSEAVPPFIVRGIGADEDRCIVQYGPKVVCNTVSDVFREAQTLDETWDGVETRDALGRVVTFNGAGSSDEIPF